MACPGLAEFHQRPAGFCPQPRHSGEISSGPGFICAIRSSSRYPKRINGSFAVNMTIFARAGPSPGKGSPDDTPRPQPATLNSTHGKWASCVAPSQRDALNARPYLEAFTKEVLRMYPPVPGGYRQLTRDVDYAGYHLPKGWTVKFDPFLCHFDPRYWHEPERFDPSRFMAPRRGQSHPPLAYPLRWRSSRMSRRTLWCTPDEGLHHRDRARISGGTTRRTAKEIQIRPYIPSGFQDAAGSSLSRNRFWPFLAKIELALAVLIGINPGMVVDASIHIF